MSNEKGFSLLELIIALSLSVAVLIGVISVATSMVRYQFEEQKKGRVTTQALYGLAQMNKQLENASYLKLPSAAVPTSNVLSGCSNWTMTTPGGARVDDFLDPDGPGPLTVAENVSNFHYCVAPPGCGGSPAAPCTLWRHSNGPDNFCNIPVVGNCGPGGGGNTEAIVYNSFYRADGGLPFFRRADDVAGVEARYIIGVATATPAYPTPQYYKVNARLSMNKSYNNATD